MILVWPNSAHNVLIGLLPASLQVSLCQKLLFLNQLNHNMTTDFSLNYKFNTWKFQAQTWGEHIVYRNCFWHSEQFLYTTCSPHVLQKRASDKVLPVFNLMQEKNCVLHKFLNMNSRFSRILNQFCLLLIYKLYLRRNTFCILLLSFIFSWQSRRESKWCKPKMSSRFGHWPFSSGWFLQRSWSPW